MKTENSITTNILEQLIFTETRIFTSKMYNYITDIILQLSLMQEDQHHIPKIARKKVQL